jgi:hypothetical protein
MINQQFPSVPISSYNQSATVPPINQAYPTTPQYSPSYSPIPSPQYNPQYSPQYIQSGSPVPPSYSPLPQPMPQQITSQQMYTKQYLPAPQYRIPPPTVIRTVQPVVIQTSPYTTQSMIRTTSVVVPMTMCERRHLRREAKRIRRAERRTQLFNTFF